LLLHKYRRFIEKDIPLTVLVNNSTNKNKTNH
jgi:hypothetical protein